MAVWFASESNALEIDQTIIYFIRRAVSHEPMEITHD